MLRPSIFGENLFEDFFDFPEFGKMEQQMNKKLYGHHANNLTISAARGLDKDEKEKETGRYIRRERYAGSCQRSFYIGTNIKQEDVKAEFKHGILSLTVPKEKPVIEQKNDHYIAIEG